VAGEVAPLGGRVFGHHEDVPCALGCGRQGTGPHFVRDLRMPGVLVRVEADDRPWYVCDACSASHGRAIACPRCGWDTHVPVGHRLRCARCGQLGPDPV